MSIREGLGYNLTYYDPCFSYNADRFCCNERGYHHRQNVILGEAPLTPSYDYTRPRNYDPDDTRPLWVKETGLVDPDPYTFTPLDRWHVWCSRMPCSLDQKGVPCQKNMPFCTSQGGCGGK